MTQNSKRLLDAVIRTDLASFIEKAFATLNAGQTFVLNWHIWTIAWHLQQVAEGNIRRLIIELPPRHLKSICASVSFPAWMLGRDPTRRIISVCYSAELAIKHARDCRIVMQSEFYSRTFPGTRIDPSKNTELELATTRKGFRLTTSVGGTLTGRGGNLIVIDDPMKPQDAMSETQREAVRQWYESTLYSRLDNKAADAIVIVMQRLHEDDLIGHVLKKEPWTVVRIPAIAEADEVHQIGPERFHRRRSGEVIDPRREPLKVLERIKTTLGTRAFSAQYQQEPLPLDGGLFKWSWFGTYEKSPEREPGTIVTQSWDTASKAGELNDYSVATTWMHHNNKHYLLHVERVRLEYPALRKRIISYAQRWIPDAVLIEDKGSGTSLLQDLRADGSLHAIAVEPDGDKVMRASRESAKIEAGTVMLPVSAPWLAEFQREILQFPGGRYADQVDSMTQYLGWFRSPRPYSIKDGFCVELETVRAYREDPFLGGNFPAPWDLDY